MPNEQFANQTTTTLASSMTNVATSGTITSATGFPAIGQFRILIDSEIILVGARSGTTISTLSRGQEGTAAASHAAGATVTVVVTAASLVNASGRHDVRAYGAKGDGTTDDTAAFALARDAAGTAGSVRVPAGTFIVNGFDWSVADQSWDVVGTIKAKASAGAGFTISASGVSFGGGKIDGNLASNASQNTGLTVTGANARIRNVRITNTRGACLTISAAHCEFVGGEIDNGNGTGVSIGAYSYATIRSNYIHDQTTGISIASGATNTRILDNRFVTVSTQYSDSGTLTTYIGNLPERALRTPHIAAVTPSGGLTGEFVVGDGLVWFNDGGVWKNIALSTGAPPSPLPTQVAAGPQTFTANNQVIENKIIDQWSGGAVTTANDQYNASPTSSVYGKGLSGCILRNCTLRGRNWGALFVDMSNLTLEDVTINDVNYAGLDLFGGTNITITRLSVNRVGRLRTNGLPSVGDVGNAYGIKMERASSSGISGASTAIPTNVTISDSTITDSRLWMGINAHEVSYLTVKDCIITGSPRGMFFAGSISNLNLLRNQMLNPLTQTGGTTDKSAISYGSVQGGIISGNRWTTGGSGYTNGLNNIDAYVSPPASSGITFSDNVGL